ncbi:heterokaryon incompatibility protein-domain-containing protein [Colletotrichum acutatum]|uniref:Heterokaryon incompatibility protein-domain-containing protein n=1 Tax=Glomerella acutata TaxID=27357 RepID=A0AAD8XAC7_GLOAC|nr:heterokaryon incompatibility protein-domain-containing protein [Colletotrichum acutatum]KAK1703661.1 heterokaryon incompatibility protein-domain-containing protein [Colletotrichum acutatum]
MPRKFDVTATKYDSGRPLDVEETILLIQGRSSEQSWQVRLQQANAWIHHCLDNHQCNGGLAAKTSQDKYENKVGDKNENRPEKGESSGARYQNSQTPKLPRRVLDLRQFDSEKKLRLIDSMTDYGVYACLSYTWGRQNTGVTTTQNLRHRLDNLPFDSLPQTYKDAVTVAAFLEIPFLWIDGLCIIQGDADFKDWAEQSSQMAEIYGNAVLVIAAADSNSVEEGFLSTPQLPRELVKFQSSDLENLNSGREGTALTVFARALPDHSWLGWSTLAEPKSRGTLSRSWCFQEEVLASRLLTFFGGEMNFQCLEDEYRCECAFPAAPLGLVTIKELYEPRLALGDMETTNWMWQSTVEHYTRRRLTVATDRLTALSGVARVVQSGLCTKYAAGHWLDRDFLCSLCWAPVRNRETERTFSKDYVAPSWSWAAHNGPITMWIPYGGSEEPVTPRFLNKTVVRNVDITPATEDDTGAVIGGSITVSGVFLDISVTMTSREQSAGVMIRSSEKIPFYFDRPTEAVRDTDNMPSGPAHYCERVGFTDFDATASDRSMKFFKGFRVSSRTAIII